MKKRIKKANAELRQVVSDIADALAVLKEVDDTVNVRREELKEVVEYIGVTKKVYTSSTTSGPPSPQGEGSEGEVLGGVSSVRKERYEEETYIIHKLRDLERDYKELVRKHNCLAEVVGELNMDSHTHWWK